MFLLAKIACKALSRSLLRDVSKVRNLQVLDAVGSDSFVRLLSSCGTTC